MSVQWFAIFVLCGVGVSAYCGDAQAQYTEELSASAEAEATEPTLAPVNRLPQPREGRPQRVWYGSEILTSDAASIAVMSIGLAVHGKADGGKSQLVLLGLAGYAFAPPLIHIVHGRWGIAGASLSLRVTLPVVGALIGASSRACPSSLGDAGVFCGSEGAVAVGLVSGMLLASALDASLFAWARPTAAPIEAVGFHLAPVLSADGKRAEVRAYGRF